MGRESNQGYDVRASVFGSRELPEEIKVGDRNRFCMYRALLFTFVLAFVFPVSADVGIPDFERVASGLEYREVKLNHPRPIVCYQLRCDPKKVKFNLLLASDLKQRSVTKTSARTIQQKFSQLAVINSSYFGHRNEVLGYAERYGQVLNPDIARDGIFSAFFYWDGGRAGLKHRSEALPKNVPVLFQAGPRLVWDGKEIEGLERRALANRSGVSIDAQGRVTLFAIGGFSMTSLSELPNLLMRSESKGGVESVRALNFDGGPSTQFCLDTKRKKAYLPGFSKVPIFLGVSERHNKW